MVAEVKRGKVVFLDRPVYRWVLVLPGHQAMYWSGAGWVSDEQRAVGFATRGDVIAVVHGMDFKGCEPKRVRA